MTRRIRIYPYKSGSQSARDLATAVGGMRLKKRGSRFRPRSTDVILIWGAGEYPEEYRTARVLNSNGIAVASNKLLSLRQMQEGGVRVPQYTTSRQEAESWVEAGSKVVCRTLLRANSGRGIVLAETVDQLVAAPLYTRYVPKIQEYRYHVFNGQVIDVQRKARRQDVPDDEVNWQIRNHDNGFIFAREGVEEDERASEQATRAVAACGLDFGAVDIIYNNREDSFYVLEVNTAPGLTGTTLEKYREAVCNLV